MGTGEGRGQSCCCLLAEWAEPWVVLDFSLYRKWESPALLGAGPLPRWGGGAAPWRVERNESQIKDRADVLLDCTQQWCQTALGREGSWLSSVWGLGAGSRACVLLGRAFLVMSGVSQSLVP